MLLFGDRSNPKSLRTGIFQALLALGTGVLLFSGQRNFLVGSKEHASFRLIGIGVALLSIAELSATNAALIPIQILVRIIACLFFLKVLTSLGKGSTATTSKINQVSDTTGNENDRIFWIVGFVLGFLAAFIPIMNAHADTRKLYPYDGEVHHMVWYFGLLVSASLISMLKPTRVWRWGIAVGLGLPTAVIVQVNTSAVQDVLPQLPVLTVVFLMIIAWIGSFAGAFVGFLLRKTIDVVRKEGWHGWF